MQNSVDALPEFGLDTARPLGAKLVAVGVSSFHEAGLYLQRLPYGWTSDPAAFRLVLDEACGTCSTKHAFLAALAHENAAPVHLMLGIYEMTDRNTPGVGRILERSGLPFIPEAHCYLRHGDVRVDLTFPREGDVEPIEELLAEREIAPAALGEKPGWHREFLRGWLSRSGAPALSLDAIWRIREECIAALSQ
jgi:hypothetical protein